MVVLLLGNTGRAHEGHSGVGLGSVAVHITGLAKHWFVRCAWSVLKQATKRSLGYP